MYWYEGMVSMHRWLAIASALIFVLRAVGTLARVRELSEGHMKVAQFCVDAPMTMAGLSLWGLLGLSLTNSPWLGLKLLALGAYVGFGALALRAKERETELLFLLLALLCLGAVFALSITRDATLGLG